LERAGTYDEAWKKERWPKLPQDFDFKYWNCAHPDLIAPRFLRGDEEILLAGFDPEGERWFRLPGHRLSVLLVRSANAAELHPLHLDTLVLDLERGKAIAIHRAVLPFPRPEALEGRMEFRDPAETEARMEVSDGQE